MPHRAPARHRVVLAVIGVAALAAAVVDLGISLVPLPAPAFPVVVLAQSALGAVVWTCTGALAARRARRGAPDRYLWRAVALCVAVVGGCVAAQPLVGARAGQPVLGLLVLSAAVLLTTFVAYDAFVRWNLTRTHSSDRGDLLNGISAVLTGTAVGRVVVDHLGGPVSQLPWWQVQPLLAAAAAALTLFGTVLSTALLAGGGRDRAAWLFVGACAAAGVGGALLAVTVLTGASVPGAGAAWAVSAGCVALAAVQEAEVGLPRAVDGASATVGAYGVVLLALLVAASEGVLPDGAGADPWVLVVAAVGAGGAATRLLLNLGELAQLATSRHQALTDELTGLANRRGVAQRLEELGGTGLPFAVALVDLDRFKEVNDGLGHAAGDELLVEVARRLRGVPDARGGRVSTAVAGRLGGDEFAVVGPVLPVTGPAAAEEAALAWGEDLAAALAPAYRLSAALVHNGASTGVAVRPSPAPGDGVDGERSGADAGAALLRRADAAMYAAKRSGGGVVLYDECRHGGTRPGLRTAEELRRALARGELVLHHQPQLDVATGALAGVEALVRWQHPDRGLLGPGDFLPAAEGHGLMGPLTSRVLELAVEQSARWREQGLDLRVSVNVSATNLADRGLPAEIAGLLLRHGVPASLLVLEVTESVLVRDDERTRRVLAELVDLGVGMSIDDFGTGWSSLAQLHRMHFTELKLDRSFTLDLLSDHRAAAITASTVDLAHALGLRVVAEGVEDDATWRRLAALGCDETQGWLHARAMPAEELVGWLAQRAGAVRAASTLGRG